MLCGAFWLEMDISVDLPFYSILSTYIPYSAHVGCSRKVTKIEKKIALKIQTTECEAEMKTRQPPPSPTNHLNFSTFYNLIQIGHHSITAL